MSSINPKIANRLASIKPSLNSLLSKKIEFTGASSCEFPVGVDIGIFITLITDPSVGNLALWGIRTRTSYKESDCQTYQGTTAESFINSLYDLANAYSNKKLQFYVFELSEKILLEKTLLTGCMGSNDNLFSKSYQLLTCLVPSAQMFSVEPEEIHELPVPSLTVILSVIKTVMCLPHAVQWSINDCAELINMRYFSSSISIVKDCNIADLQYKIINKMDSYAAVVCRLAYLDHISRGNFIIFILIFDRFIIIEFWHFYFLLFII